MSRIFISLVCCCITFTLSAQVPNFVWARQFGFSKSGTYNLHLAMAPGEQLLAAGNFTEYANFAHGSEKYFFDAGKSSDIFFNKTTATGDFLWAKQIRSIRPGGIVMNALITDSQGNIFITGEYIDTVDFDPQPLVDFKVAAVEKSNSDQDIFIAKYNATGGLLWVKTIGYIDTDIATGLALLSNGNLIVTGRYRFTVDFDPGPAVANLSSSTQAIFILTLTSDGEYIDAKSISYGGSTNILDVQLTESDSDDNLYLSGVYLGTVDFDPGPDKFMVTAPNAGVPSFICKLNKELKCLWVKTIATTSLGFIPTDLKVNADKAVCLVGTFWQNMEFEPADSTGFSLISAGNSDAIALKIDSNGTFVWGKHFGSTGSDEATALAIDNNGNWQIGINSRSDSIDVDPGQATHWLINSGNYDAALVRLNTEGDFMSMSQFTGQQLQQINAIVTSSNAIYTGGTFVGPSDFDPGEGAFSLSPKAGWDFYIQKMSMSPATIDKIEQFDDIKLYPNPTCGLFTLARANSTAGHIKIFNSTGGLVKSFPVTSLTCDLDLSQQTAGLYLVQLSTEKGGTQTFKILKQ